PVDNSSADESNTSIVEPMDEGEPAVSSEETEGEADAHNGTANHNGDNDERGADDGEVSIIEEASTSMYLPYDKKTWSPLSLYRTPQQMIMMAIRQSGSEGVSRIDLGRVIGLNAGMKSGGRRVSNYIVAAQKAYPQLIDHYQQMDGRQRMFKFFWKPSAQPEKLLGVLREFEGAAGRPCPFDIGQVIKFPGTKLNTLRISDRSLERLTRIMTLLEEKRIIVTMHCLTKMMVDAEQAAGYMFQMDKKSLLKCLYALRREHLLHIYELTVCEDSVENKVTVVCHRSVTSPDSPEVDAAIKRAIGEFHAAGRVFPHGQLRFATNMNRRRKEENGETPGKGPVDEQPAPIRGLSAEELAMSEKIDPTKPMTLMERLVFMRVRATKMAIVKAEPSEHSSPARPGDALKQSKKKAAKLVLDESFDSGADVKASPVGSKRHYDQAVSYGYQSKMIRCQLLHEVLFYMMHGYKGSGPSFYDKYPPSQTATMRMKLTKENGAAPHVYLNEESYKRFLPPLPDYKERKRGWFLLQDFADALPLSIFVMVIKFFYRIPELDDYLEDPVKRHMLVSDLPPHLCRMLWQDKRYIKQVEQHLFTMCAFGLLAMAKNPDPRRYNVVGSEYFFLFTRGELADTSTSERAYAQVTPPLDRYRIWEYEFTSERELLLYWHHMRAIVASTELSYRSEVPTEPSMKNRTRRYAVAGAEKAAVWHDIDNFPERVEPFEPRDSVCGFDAGIFAHLKRNWELNLQPPRVVDWFMNEWRRRADQLGPIVEQRVDVIKPGWNSYVKALMPTENFLLHASKKGATPRSADMAMSANSLSKLRMKRGPAMGSARPRVISKQKKGKKERSNKRIRDRIDVLSEQRRIHMRSRFSAKERDMLIFIRAVSYFLNPVFRFWLDPCVLRDIMHDQVPESKTKTVQCLMAASVREMARPGRLAYMQRIVKRLSNIKEMSAIRNKFAAEQLMTMDSKTTFFLEAFDTANRLLFRDQTSAPPVTAHTAPLEEFLKTHELAATEAVDGSTVQPPKRSLEPALVGDISECVAFNIIVSMMSLPLELQNTLDYNGALSQFPASALTSLFQALRTDGLLARGKRSNESAEVGAEFASLSVHFRHFFNHRFHDAIVEQTAQVINQLRSKRIHTSASEETGAISVAASTTCTNQCAFDLTIPEKVIASFAQQRELPDGDMSDEKGNASLPSSVTKHLRQLESSDIRLNEISVTLSAQCPAPDNPQRPLTNFAAKVSTLIALDKAVVPFDDYLLELPVDDRPLARRIHALIEASTVFGITWENLSRQLEESENENKLTDAIEKMVGACQVIRAGVSAVHLVAIRHAQPWLLTGTNKDGVAISYQPRPWLLPNGTVQYPVLRWMAEGVFATVLAKPGIALDAIVAEFSFALQPRLVIELLDALVDCGSLLRTALRKTTTVPKSPFDNIDKTVEQIIFEPTADCMEKFADVFAKIQLPEMLRSTQADP
uniref:General transcription factor 3C polypeptide 1 n=1 Tax=Plectus sambesii TaxID=2011161 RepID=A0A914WRI4_9BILA